MRRTLGGHGPHCVGRGTRTPEEPLARHVGASVGPVTGGRRAGAQVRQKMLRKRRSMYATNFGVVVSGPSRQPDQRSSSTACALW